MKKRLLSLLTSLLMMCSIMVVVPDMSASASSYSGDYRYWSQGGSDYVGMREVGCLITAQSKMLYEANIIRESYFNPDQWYLWLLNHGYIASSSNLNMKDHKAPVYYANSIGKNLEYLGYWKASDDQLWFNINAGYYTILNVSGTNTGGQHFVLIDNELSKSTGKLYCYDSFSDRGSVSPQLISRYSEHNGGHVYKANNPTHTHSYTSTVTTQPTCTAAGVRTYTCSCGSSYTETIPAKGHSYVNKVVAPTTTEKGYTIHTCSVCGNSYKDTYVDPPKKNDDGWYYCDTLPTGISSDKYTIQYNNYYEKIQTTSPGSDWTNAGTVKTEWQNSGSQYKSAYDLTTSDSRILVSSIYYHFCGPKAGNEANYEQSGNFVHYDWIAADRVVSTYLGDDNGHPYYFINWPGGNQIYCATNVTCDGTYGSHSARSRAWYKENTYQDRVKVVSNKYTKNSGWVTTKDSGASSVKIRYKLKECTHSFSEWKVTTPATCTQEGIKTRTCSICGAAETAKVSKTQHSYTTKVVAATADAKGYTLHTCSVCGDSYKDNYTDYVSTAPQIKVASRTCAAGDSIKVQIYLENNPGIISIRLNAEYDSDVLTLESASAGSFEDVTFGPTNKDPFTILWSDSIHGNNSTNGILAELTFKVKDDAPEGNYPITVSYDKEEIFDENFKNVEFTTVNGSVTVSSAIPGDINGDGKVNMKDYAQLQRYLNNWDVSIEESAADVNKDGKINMKDYALLQQYLNGWDVVLK